MCISHRNNPPLSERGCSLRPRSNVNIHRIRNQRVVVFIIHCLSERKNNRHVEFSMRRTRRYWIHSLSLLVHDIE